MIDHVHLCVCVWDLSITLFQLHCDSDHHLSQPSAQKNVLPVVVASDVVDDFHDVADVHDHEVDVLPEENVY